MLIVGLGNPGSEYRHTRHNIGREIVEQFREKNDFPDFRFEKKWNAHISEKRIGKEKVALVLPETMMNNSGKTVGPLLRFLRIAGKNLFVIHDDADIPLGKGKMAFAKSSAGHKGVESVIRALKKSEFWRFRIGIGAKRDVPAEKLVLKRWRPEEARAVKKIAAKTLSALEEAILRGPEMAMNEYNK